MTEEERIFKEFSLGKNKYYITDKGIIEVKEIDGQEIVSGPVIRISIQKIRKIVVTTTTDIIYEITYKDVDSGVEKTASGTLEEIFKFFKETYPLRVDDKQFKRILSSLIEHYAYTEQLEVVVKHIPGWGFYYDDKNQRIERDAIFENTSLDMSFYNLEEEERNKKVKEAYDALRYLIKEYAKDKRHEQVIWNIIYAGLGATFGYARKQLGNIVNVPILIVGDSGTAKTFTMHLIKAILGVFGHKDFEDTGTTLSYAPRLAHRLTLTTFPLFGDEARAIINYFSANSDKAIEILEMFKNISENLYDSRSHVKKRFVPLRTIFLTSNYPVKSKIHDAIAVRMLYIKMDNKWKHTSNERKRIMQMFKKEHHKLKTLFEGFVLILDLEEEYNEEFIGILRDSDNLQEIGKWILETTLSYHNIKPNLPDVIDMSFDYDITDEETLNIIEMINNTILKELNKFINDNVELSKRMREEGLKSTLRYMINENILPDFLYVNKDRTKLLLTAQIIPYVEREYGDVLPASGLKGVAESYGLEYVKERFLSKSNGDSTTKRGIIIKRFVIDDLIDISWKFFLIEMRHDSELVRPKEINHVSQKIEDVEDVTCETHETQDFLKNNNNFSTLDVSYVSQVPNVSNVSDVSNNKINNNIEEKKKEIKERILSIGKELGVFTLIDILFYFTNEEEDFVEDCLRELIEEQQIYEARPGEYMLI